MRECNVVRFNFCVILGALRQMEMQEVTIAFADSHHGGDKRKRSQSCALSFSMRANNN